MFHTFHMHVRVCGVGDVVVAFVFHISQPDKKPHVQIIIQLHISALLLSLLLAFFN